MPRSLSRESLICGWQDLAGLQGHIRNAIIDYMNAVAFSHNPIGSQNR